MELKDIYSLWDRFENSAVSQLELDMHGVHLKLSKDTCGKESYVQSPVANPARLSDSALLSNAVMRQDAHFPGKEQKTDSKEVKAPLVGIFYRASAPGEKPFVCEGQKVAKGDVIGIIEAMKVMNEITASDNGTVETVLAEDGVMVEYGQTLITIIPD